MLCTSVDNTDAFVADYLSGASLCSKRHVYPRTAISRMRLFRDDNKRLTPRSDWLWAVLLREFVRQNCNVVVVPLETFARVVYGGRKRPRNWNVLVKRMILRRMELVEDGFDYRYYRKSSEPFSYGSAANDFGVNPRTPNGATAKATGTKCKVINELGDSVVLTYHAGHKNSTCPSACPSYTNRKRDRHAHFAFYIPPRMLGVLHMPSPESWVVGTWCNSKPIYFYKRHTRAKVKKLATRDRLASRYNAMNILGYAAGFSKSQIRLFNSMWCGLVWDKNAKSIYKKRKPFLVDGFTQRAPELKGRWAVISGSVRQFANEQYPTVGDRMYFAAYANKEHVSDSDYPRLVKFLQDIRVLEERLGMRLVIFTNSSCLYFADVMRYINTLASGKSALALKQFLSYKSLVYWPEDFMESFKDSIMADASLSQTSQEVASPAKETNEIDDIMLAVVAKLKAKKLRKKDFALTIGVSAVTASLYFNGKVRPRPTVLTRIKEFLDKN